ncbi:unnamed protein product [Symbiodinium necroappetens]|uniref:Uncharacterized protein n=1 Tax=Symbiodinium necroappetens TaxID=1628268 RepID=A0A812TCJ4_9DINO|nr:unnamed protein product [Symbiodinium necroappetens]
MILDKDPKFKGKFMKACRVRAGEEDETGHEIPRPSDVMDFEETSMEVFVELGLLTEAEFDKLSGLSSVNLTGPILRAEMIELPSQFGLPKKFFLFSLEGLGCDIVHGLRRLRVSCRFGIRHEELLLLAARQLIEGQGRAVYSFHAAKQLENNPKGLTAETSFASIRTYDALKERIQKLSKDKPLSKAEAAKPPSDEESEDGTRKVQPAESSRVARGVAVQPKRKSAKGAGRKKAGDQEEVATVDGDPDQLPAALQPVVQALKQTPKCFLNCDPVRLLSGEKLMRSVDAATRLKCGYAKRVCEDMQKAKQFQHKFLSKHIDICECANALANSMENMGNRELDVCVTKLLGESIVIPWPIQVQVSARKIQFKLEELCDTQSANMAKLTDEIMDMICAWKHISHPVRHESDDDEETAKEKEMSVTWSSSRCSFDLLWMDVEGDIQDAGDLSAEAQTQLEAKSEAEGVPFVIS